ncbi:MAG: type 1 glutamine amidotransferase [Actinobacteria bacterium]|nr:MAG: type 1 glutamine amidotransferase [Actinomycetota bacterium]
MRKSRQRTGKNVIVLVENEFEDAELVEPIKHLKRAGLSVRLAGPEPAKIYRGKKGTTVKSDLKPSEVKLNDVDAIIVPGGYAPDKLRLSKPMVNLVKRADEQGTIIAAICHGPQLLISAGIIKDRNVTGWPSIVIDIENAGGKYINQAVVRDENLITSRRPSDIPQFNKVLLAALGREAALKKVAA